jgi:hypothetical protein
MDYDKDLNLIIHDLQQLLTEKIAYHEDGIREHREQIRKTKDLDRRLALLQTSGRPAGDSVARSKLGQVAIANGRRLSPEEFAFLDEDKYDVILNMTTYTLRFRINPGDHTQLIERDLEELENVGSHRIKLLAYMLERPKRYVSTENAPTCYGDPEERRTPAALRKTVSLLREALGVPGPNNPYIKTKRSVSPCVYLLNPKWRYLLIRWKT